MTEEQIRYMRDRFLSWNLPADFNPDCGIHFDANAAKKLNPNNHRYEPQGTNLFDAAQADAMVRHMIGGLSRHDTEHGAIIHEAIRALAQIEMAHRGSDDHSREMFTQACHARLKLLRVQSELEDNCPGHVASARDSKICARCGVHVDSFRPSEPDGP